MPREVSVSNHGALAILALTVKRRRKVPSPDEADLRWLITLETFPAGENGWRMVGAKLLAEEAGLAYSTSRAARDRLVAAGVVEYRPGNGAGKRSRYRFAAPLKVPTWERHLAEAGADELDGPNKGADPSSAPFPGKGADHDSAPSGTGKGAETPPEKVPRHAKKGAEHNPLTSGNENTALEAFALETSALSPRARVARKVRQAVPDATEREIDLLAAQVETERSPDHVDRYVASYPDTTIAEMIAAIRARGTASGPVPVADLRAVHAGSTPTPVPPQYGDRCGWCSRPGHAAGSCPDRPEPEARPVLTEAETPCAAGEGCRQKHTGVDDGQEYHKACQIFGDLRAARERAKRADHDEVGRRIAAEQLAEIRGAAPTQDGGHAA